MYNILIVDDELISRRGIRAILQKSDFCIGRLAEAADGVEAISLLRKEKFDIVITDIRMPNMDGIMLCKSIQNEGMSPSIVILSGYDDFKYAQQAILYGVSDYILKPITQKKLTESLTRIMSRQDGTDRSLKYEEIDRFVTGLLESLREGDRADFEQAGEKMRIRLEGQQETLIEIVLNVANKIADRLQIQFSADDFRENSFEDGMERLWKMVNDRKGRDLLETVRKYLLDDPGMSQERLCSMLGFTSSYFSAMFKERTGRKFVEYREQIRMEVAKRELCIPSKTITQVAIETGYSDHTHFSRVFKKFYGKTPAQFRKERGLRL
ncbi:MAG TPA: response regulator [Candidatus Eisenbergiella merdavium]|uniref:Stage 0 sporulation protein A homolog n=1 Tax=Candidatus Eisenbergiella merdavium TaxID=2838551 RepID=A0A9D2SS09_9FIRM|nr:response regulator [Candidatus Eisenbergiella merdavium]